MPQRTETDRIVTRRPLLAAGLLAGSGLVDVVTAYANTVDDAFMMVTARGIYLLDITGWAWLHLAVGAAVALAGFLVVTGRRWAARAAIVGAGLAIAIDLLLFPYAPIRALLVVGLSGAAIRLLLRHGRTRPVGAAPGGGASPAGTVSEPRRSGR